VSNETISDLRKRLFAAIDGVKDGSCSLEQARVIAELSQVMVNTAKAENEFLRITDRQESPFLGTEPRLLPNGILSITRHKLKDD
jgi:hypothetical protein